ncbi:hypothetical protein L211DRAFT_854203 [Terfezia boudieri ATCC MYA-4762]|uniref:Uncharacterized protein n=1 Tax=Terfezia boudieri ATCC MYA-4762 TaxID=1051890 RepID=A0A3N4L617_9PEZI|nr:hypothetical protein L211DRAFT_854203 [Terfezia boudieri ATCC MYA-4762]
MELENAPVATIAQISGLVQNLGHRFSAFETRLETIETYMVELQQTAGQENPPEPQNTVLLRRLPNRSTNDIEDNIVVVNILPLEKFGGDRAALEGFPFQVQDYFIL